MTYVELNDEDNSIIDTRGIRNISVDNVSDDLHYIKIRYKYKDTSCSYEYKDIETLYEDREKIKEKLGF
jgi:hypothetical protein